MGNIQSVEFLLPDGREYDQNTLKTMRFFRSDEGFIPTMNIELIAGRNFDPVKDSAGAFIVNEATVHVLDLDDPVGTVATNTTFGTRGEIVGVMKDFNFASLHQEIEPLVLTYRPEWASTIVIKIDGDRIKPALAHIENTVKEVAPGTLFHYDFIDENLNQLYGSEDKMGTIFKIFAVLAIVISCMGLYGIAAYNSEIRTKEIGIRKAFGASFSNILVMLCRSYLALIFIALVIAIPVANYFITEWMTNFAYHTLISWEIFLGSGVLVIVTAFVAVSSRAIRAAGINPARSLRFE
jgi:putative ABC transport system permease protein